MKQQFKKLFIDVGVGKPNSEAWGRENRFVIIGLEPCIARYNRCKDVYPGELLNVAASDRNEELDCWEEPGGEHGVVVFKSVEYDNFNMRKVKKKAIKLDSLEWRGFDEIHIWADIEGSELIMLKGAIEMLLSGKVKWINLEIRKFAVAGDDRWPTAKQIYDFLAKFGFKPMMSIDQLNPKKHRDVIFIPK